MQIVQEIKKIQERQQQSSKLVSEIFSDLLIIQKSLESLRVIPKQLRQSKSTFILISANQESSPLPKITRNASLKTEDFLEQCMKKIEQANKIQEISNQSPPPKHVNRIKGRLEKHIPELKTQEVQIPLPTSSLQSIITSSNSPQQKLSQLMQMDDFQTREGKDKNQIQIFNIHEEGQLQQ